jgi:two-component system, LytTR family, response regulator
MTPIKAFIVDDEADACELLQNLLSAFSAFGVTQTYSDALQALDAAITETPDIIFLDIGMPEITGLEFLKQVNEFTPETRVVFVSAHKNYALEALQNNAFDFIPKPVDKNELRRVVHKITVAKYRQQTANIRITVFCLKLQKATIIFHLKMCCFWKPTATTPNLY